MKPLKNKVSITLDGDIIQQIKEAVHATGADWKKRHHRAGRKG